jgi:hypothetical protein
VACPITLSIADAALAQRLYDPTGQFWTQAERLLYIQEAMRCWNALTAYWRGDFTFPSQAMVAWYDITNLTTAPNTLRPPTLTTTNLYTIIEYHLLEPPVGAGAWTGSAQFALSDIQNAVTQRINELLGASGCSITQSLVAATPGRIALPPTTLDLRRVAFLPASSGLGSPQTLWQDDSWAWESFEPNYTILPQGVPSTYATSTQPLFAFDVDRTLNVAGQYELLTTQATAGATGASVIVPDDWAWVAKYGALADLLGRESNAKDALRQRYCEQRYAEGMSLLALAPALLGLRVNNIPVEIDSVRAADQYNTGWEGAPPTAPAMALVAGLNLIALTPTPDTGAYTLTATVVENCPVPLIGTDCINVTEDVYEAILDEAQHVAMLKCGGAEFLATVPMHQRFLSLAALYSSKIAEMGEFAQVLYAQSRLEASANPRMTADTPAEVMDNA